MFPAFNQTLLKHYKVYKGNFSFGKVFTGGLLKSKGEVIKLLLVHLWVNIYYLIPKFEPTVRNLYTDEIKLGSLLTVTRDVLST